MSAGIFEVSKYETNSPALGGIIMPIRVQPETIAAIIGGVSNAAPAGDVDVPLRVSVSAGNTEYGVKPRKAVLRFTGAAPADYSGDDVSIALLTPAIAAAAIPGATGTYLGAAVEVISSRPESFR